MCGVAIDFEARGPARRRAATGRAREARLELLRTLEHEGFTLDELRRAAGEDRLALLPVERVLEAEGPRYTQREVAGEPGSSSTSCDEARRALGDPAVEPGERVLTDEDLELARNAAVLLASRPRPRTSFLELTRVMSQAMATRGRRALSRPRARRCCGPATPSATSGCATRSRCGTSARWPAPRSSTCSTCACASRCARRWSARPSSRAAGFPGAQRDRGRLRRHRRASPRLGEQVPPDELGAVVRRVRARASRTPRGRRCGSSRRSATRPCWSRPSPTRCSTRCSGSSTTPPRTPRAPLLRGGMACGRGAASAPATGTAGPVNLAEPAHRVRPPRQRGGHRGGARRRARRLPLVVRGQPPLQGRERRGGGLPGAYRGSEASERVVDSVQPSQGSFRLAGEARARASGSSTPPTTCSAGTAYAPSAWTGSSSRPAWRR